MVKDPGELSREELIEIVRAVQNTLWPDGDPDHEWDAETIEAVARVLSDAGLMPIRP